MIRASDTDASRDLRSLLGGSSCVTLAELGISGGHLDLAPGLGVMEDEHPDIGKCEFDRVDHFDTQHIVAEGEGAQRSIPRAGIEEIGDHDDQASSLGGPGDATQSGRQIGATGLRGIEGSQHLTEKRLHMHPSGTGGDRGRGALRTEGHRPDAVPGPSSEEAGRSDPGKSQVTLFTSGGAEGQRRRSIDHDPCLEFAVGDAVAHMGLTQASGDVPIDTANIVTWLIGAYLTGLGSVTGGKASVVALKQSVESTGHGDFESAEDLRGWSPVDGGCRGLLGAHRPETAVGFCDGAMTGACTVERSRARICSTERPWASAS